MGAAVSAGRRGAEVKLSFFFWRRSKRVSKKKKTRNNLIRSLSETLSLFLSFFSFFFSMALAAASEVASKAVSLVKFGAGVYLFRDWLCEPTVVSGERERRRERLIFFLAIKQKKENLSQPRPNKKNVLSASAPRCSRRSPPAATSSSPSLSASARAVCVWETWLSLARRPTPGTRSASACSASAATSSRSENRAPLFPLLLLLLRSLALVLPAAAQSQPVSSSLTGTRGSRATTSSTAPTRGPTGPCPWRSSGRASTSARGRPRGSGELLVGKKAVRPLGGNETGGDGTSRSIITIFRYHIWSNTTILR